jgi:hypothetical protein
MNFTVAYRNALRARVRRRHIAQSGVLPEYITLYAHAICEQPVRTPETYASGIEAARNCVAAMVVPPVETQGVILNAFHSIAMHTDIKNFEGPLLRLMLADDLDTLQALVSAIVEYNASIDRIAAMISRIPDVVSKTNVV